MRIYRTVTIALLFFLINHQLRGQSAQLKNVVDNQIRHYCSICINRPGDTARVLIAKQLMEPSWRVNFHNSHVSQAEKDLDAAYDYILQTMEDIDNDTSHPIYAAALFMKSGIQYKKDLLEEALRGYQYLIGHKGLDSILQANSYINIAEIYNRQEKYPLSLQYYDTWERKFGPQVDTFTLKSVYHNKALCFFYLKRFDEAEGYFMRSMRIEERLGDTTGLAISSMDIANLYYEQYMDAKAIPLFEKGLALAKRAGDMEVLRNAYKNMAVVEQNRKRYNEALEYRRQFEMIQDSIWNRDHVWELARQERKLALQKREHTIRVLDWQRNSLLIAVMAILLMACGIWLAYRAQIRSKRIIAKQKEELDILNQTKDRLFSIVAHDLRSPVYRLKANLTRLRKAIWQQELTKAAELAASNEKIAGSTYVMMDNLLHWALSQTGQLYFRPEKLHLRTVINMICHDLIPLANDKQVTIHQVIAEEVTFAADLHSFKIIVRNLMDNAIKYTPAGGDITISACLAEKDECHIQIRDTGVGMDEEALQALFDPERKKIRQDTQGHEGTGLGLWLCKTMTEKNNGRLTVTSEVGKGTTFTICLPVNA
ncbi:sensor histidine kinase [Chitinophaga agrisoli]|uniref:histidine kinase n=1 Tax=Chitinophaga agrisoli TaxID=2607653 RepID=A0A5B2VG96_9BACT|nr:tetratricopeptide repeat-containing sensor histidine kinase [Chitinophaga agrisoli]KAA2238573.1 sensor histidine kinase [Chitinophaga agrisoli]